MVENGLWNIREAVQGTTGHYGAKTWGFQRHYFTCVVLHMLRTHRGRAHRAPTPAYEAAEQNE